MTHVDTGKTADVHPNEVDNMKPYGWRVSVPAVVPPPPPAPEKPKLSLPPKKD
jgi:hypothetical protein